MFLTFDLSTSRKFQISLSQMSELSCGNGLANGMTEAQTGTPFGATTLQVSALPVGHWSGTQSVSIEPLGYFPKYLDVFFVLMP